MRRLAIVLVVALSLAPALLRRIPGPSERRCSAEGRGAPPRHWLGCAADGGAPRGLSGDERLLLGRPLELNGATARELSFVPGLTRALAAEVVADRAQAGPFRGVDELLRVRGIGPRRLERARPFLGVEPVRVGVADGGE